MWIGKIIGAIFGYMLARLPGAILGFIVGNIFDRGFSGQYRLNPQQQSQIQNTFFRVTFLVMGYIAKSDGRVSEDEIQVARSIMQRMHLNEHQKRQAIDYFNQGKQASFSLNQALDELDQACHRQRLLLRMFIEIQFQAAMGSGKLTPHKQQILQQICERFGLGMAFSQFAGLYEQVFGAGRQQHYQQYQQSHSYKPSLSDDYKVLGIAADASKTEIKRAYRRLMSQHHPDKLIAQGLPEEMIKLATDKTQTIQAAYERIKQAKGI